MTQPEALRLADALDDEFTQGRISNHNGRKAAAELRRLHAELERCKQVCAATAEEWRADAEKWKDQRDALLEALRDAAKTIEHLGYPLAAIERARAAIAKAEGKQ